MAEAGGEDALALTIDSIAVGGDGVARDADGRVVFVPRAAPGDTIRARVVESRSSWARARVEEVLEEGPDRRRAPCPVYEVCGGCQLQHLKRSAQERAKRLAVRDALERIGGRSVDVGPVVAPGPEFGYRNRISLTLRRTSGGAVRAGYHRFDDATRLVDVSRCPLAEEPVNVAWEALRKAWGPGAERLPPGRELRVTLRSTVEGAVGLLLEGGGPDRGDEGARAGELVDAVEPLASVHWRPAGGQLRSLAGAERLYERWDGVALSLHPEAFLQVNRSVAKAMEAHLDELVGEVRGRRILDLYAGAGLRAIRWSRRGADAVACEVHPGAVETGRRAARSEGVDVDFREGRVEQLADGLAPADVAVVNPPRQGLSKPVSAWLRAADVGALAYVSCDPATLARDLKRLGDRWRVGSVRPFDAFPQTAHVETIVWSTPRGRAGDGP